MSEPTTQQTSDWRARLELAIWHHDQGATAMIVSEIYRAGYAAGYDEPEPDYADMVVVHSKPTRRYRLVPMDLGTAGETVGETTEER